MTKFALLSDLIERMMSIIEIFIKFFRSPSEMMRSVDERDGGKPK
jgi:hypothetical protein